MEFPGNLRSNVYEITGITQVFWNLCSPSLPDAESSTSQRVNKWQVRLLQLEAQLRTDDRHVSVDFDARGVWVFCLSQDTQDDLNETVEFFDLKVHEQGNLQHPEKYRHASQPSPSPQDQIPLTPPAGRVELDPNILEIVHAQFIHSVQRSLALKFTLNSDSWSLFDEHSCIDIDTTGLKESGDPDHSDQMVFKCKWTSSGSLLVYTVLNHIPKLYCLADFITQDNFNDVLNARVRLLPTYCVGAVRGIESFFDLKPKVDTLEEAKQFLTEILATLNLSVFYRESWAILSSGGGTTLWPSKYCFCETPQEFFDVLEGKPHADFTVLDPIARAEAWYNGRFEREKAVLEDEQKNHDEVAKHSTAANTPAAVSPLSHRTYLQDPSTVYPTPPDGLTSSAKETPKQESTEESHANAPDGNSNGNELFGENDMDLTEADFDFFDDPDAETPTTKVASDSKDGVSISGGINSATPTSVENIVDTPILEPSLSELQHHSATDLDTSIEYSDEHQKSNLGERRTSDLHSETRGGEHVAYPEHNVLGLISPAPTASDMTPAASTREPESIDDKYLEDGVFGAEVDQAHFASPQVAKRGSSHIPLIGFVSVSASDSDSESSEEDLGQHTPRSSVNPNQVPENSEQELPIGVSSDEDMLLRGQVQALPLVLLVSARGDHAQASLDEGPAPEVLFEDGRHVISMAQIMLDQAFIAKNESNKLIDKDSMPWPVRRTYHENTVSSMMQPVFGVSETHSLDALLNRAFETRSTESTPSPVLDLLNPPLVRIRRADALYDVLPSASNFWDDLGLEPASGPKDVVAACVSLQYKDHLRLPMERFLRSLADAYHACNLGSHHSMQSDLLQDTEGDFYSLGGELGANAQVDNSDALVVYVVHSALTPDFCAKALRLLEGFQTSQMADGSGIDLVVQYIPETLIFDPTCAMPASFEDFKKIAFEVYDRIGPAEEGKSSFETAPAIILAREVPSKIEFEVISDSSAATLYHDTTLHVAYSLNANGDWLTASWTNSTGTLQWNAAYVVGDATEKWAGFGEIAEEVIGTTLEMVRSSKRRFRIFLAKYGDIDSDELIAWKTAISRIATPASRSFYIMSIRDQPDLQSSLPNSDDPLPELDDPLPSLPSTPNAAAMSPDASGATPGPTAAFEEEADSRIFDIRDETWAYFPASVLETDALVTTSIAPISEGYLLKRAGVKDGDGLCALAVRLLSIPDSETGRAVLAEVLDAYYKLAILARLRSISDRFTGVLPIHVAMTCKGLATVSSAMRWSGITEDG